MFHLKIDFDEWPSVHPSDKELMRGYSFPIFEIRKHYRTIFSEDEFEPMSMDDNENGSSKKVNKILYSINLLPIIGSHYQRTMDQYSKQLNAEFMKEEIFTTGMFADADDIEIFRS